MNLTPIEEKIYDLISLEIEEAAPGVAVTAHHKGRLICDLQVGMTYPFYDLASLTKIIFTVPVMMKAFDEKLWDLKTRVHEILPWFPHKRVLIKDLLSHTSGLPWWFDFYKRLNPAGSEFARWSDTAKLIRDMKLEPGQIAVYSDVGFILLGFIIENFYQLPLIEVWHHLKSNLYPGTTFEFNPLVNLLPGDATAAEQKKIKGFFAPTEICPWRKKVLQGEVHDDNAYAMGGVATHAGLFGSIQDLSTYACILRELLHSPQKYFISQKTMRLFTHRAMTPQVGDWTLGFMMPTPGVSSSGQYFSKSSFGHTGFTGTSYWYDPQKDLSVQILSNRVLFGRDNKAFARGLRPHIHNWIVKELK